MHHFAPFLLSTLLMPAPSDRLEPSEVPGPLYVVWADADTAARAIPITMEVRREVVFIKVEYGFSGTKIQKL